MVNQPIFSVSSNDREKLETVCNRSRIRLLGVTGGIASGKSTIADLLQKKGAALIDFDVLAREAVEPGEKAFHAIVDYFGDAVLQTDGRLDRKKISSIVFQDDEKRKVLMNFIYPRIAEMFIQRVEEFAKKSTRNIILAVVPLLIEENMQGLFQKIILVHIPREKQIERLMERDGITRSKAEAILNAQMPIDAKLKYADFVIHNEGDLDSTRNQVDGLWNALHESERKD
ncbi:MAG: dephospho-CoA kinase [Deltaproteobacteria bacterium]|nr:dephospho-CoA kinase [Deltaproteobacteria bacterium]